ncbi:YHS domain-containing (seleno)protein [Jiulongibacter sp. NS-SX5]|uniref:YHS domain-containing (seleno)protein n=1 Tax=Jiulongibacter sp. NS-SX5 TaxID=3463854 RepID=UPI00405981BA
MKKLAFLLIVLGLTFNGFGQKSKIFKTKNGALDGYDPVAYFTSKKATKGGETFTSSYNGVTWKFTSNEHKSLFEANPEQYLPQYGGWCAFGWSKGYAAKVDPEEWTILNGKLYLNYNEGVHKKWLKDKENMIRKADVKYAEAKVDPEEWTILNGKLYLNYNEGVHKKWLKDKENMIRKADVKYAEAQMK